MRMLTRPSQHGELVVYAAWWSKAASDICKRAGFRVGQVKNGFLPFCAVVDGHWLWKCTVSPLVHLVEGFNFVCLCGWDRKSWPRCLGGMAGCLGCPCILFEFGIFGSDGNLAKDSESGVFVAVSGTFEAVTVLFYDPFDRALSKRRTCHKTSRATNKGREDTMYPATPRGNEQGDSDLRYVFWDPCIGTNVCEILSLVRIGSETRLAGGPRSWVVHQFT